MTLRAVLLIVLAVGWTRTVCAFEGARRESGRVYLTAAGATALVVVALAWLSGPLLDRLDVDTETFRIATGLTVAAVGLARVLGWGTGREEDVTDRLRWLWPLTYPVLVGPELVFVAVSAGSDHGVLLTTSAAGFGLVLGAVMWRVWPDRSGGWLVRVSGAATIALSVALIFDGLRDI